MNKEQLIKELYELIRIGKEISSPNNLVLYPNVRIDVSDTAFKSWKTKILYLLKRFLDNEDDFYKSILLAESNQKDTIDCIETLQCIIDYINKGFITFEKNVSANCNRTLDIVFKNFHKVVCQLQYRHDNRSTIEVNDEYDVQDLLKSLLQLYYDDIRSEEWTPSHAGKSSRVDFLLKSEQIVIEVKKTRQGLADKELGEQLILDIAKYQTHPDCKRLYFFVYDPERRIINKNGIINDLETQNGNFVKVIIKPD